VENLGEILKSNPLLSKPTKNREDLTRTCPVCSKTLNPVEVDFLGQKKLCPIRCQCEIDEYERQEKERREAERRRRVQKYFSIADVGEKLKDASFKDYEKVQGNQIAFREAALFVKEFEARKKLPSQKGLLIYGRSGNGKSHLAAAIAKNLNGKGYIVVFQNVPKFIRQLAANFSEAETRLLQAITEADVVILDDVGSGSWNKIYQGKFEEIMECLSFNNKVLVATTNLDPMGNMESTLGERSMDRLIDLCRLVENKAKSYRRKRAAEKIGG